MAAEQAQLQAGTAGGAGSDVMPGFTDADFAAQFNSSKQDIADRTAEAAKELEQRDLNRSLHQLIETTPTLNPQQREVLRCRYLTPTPLTHVQIASRLNINRDTCRRLERSALAVLKARGIRIRAFLPN
jgi:RNA polymerase sigma factor (sigma-70 family)